MLMKITSVNKESYSSEEWKPGLLKRIFDGGMANYGVDEWEIKCDLCDRKWKCNFYWSIYTGCDLFGPSDTEVLRVGPRKTRIDVCKKHKSSEITRRLDEIEANYRKQKGPNLPPIMC